ncbi:MAG TPA: hypothetical protein VJK02_12540 [Anaerolineales bacterium]|nr:hypothetical protein [Anaerolineales bacterium]
MALNFSEGDLLRERLAFASRRNGLWIGLISGVAFGLTSWGIDALALRDASVDLPWAKLAIGLTFALVIGGLAGWLTALIDHAAVGTLFWGLAGIAYAWLVGHLPFEGLSALLRFTEPHLGNIAAYPFVESARVRTILLMIIVGGLCALGGSLELVLLDQSSDASTGLARAFSMGLTIPFFALAGFASDGVINRPLREPLVAVDRLIGWAIEDRNNPIDPALAQQRHLGAVGGIDELIDRPYRMSLGSYDPVSLISFTVELDFDGTWARCSVLASAPGYCGETDPVYQAALACLGGGGQDCTVDSSESVRPWIDQLIRRNEPPTSITVLNHTAAVVLVDLAWPEGGHDLCVFEGAQPITLTRCTPAEGP